jgi:hypothetical protein
MSKIVTWCIGLALVGALAGCGQSAAAVRAAGLWGRAIEVPGLGALNKGGEAAVNSVACGSAGNCAAGGSYLDSVGNNQGFVVSERYGRWGKAIDVPGLAALNKGQSAEVTSVSCGSAGNCAAVGDYTDRRGNGQGFVVSERNGRWGKAIDVPGLAALNTYQEAQVTSVSCASAGNCAAGGYYTDRHGQQGFVAVERHGRWGRAIEVPGLGALNTGTGGDAQVTSVSCASAGSCAAGGYYADGDGHYQGFVAVERNGRWGKAIKVPGLAALNTGGNARVDSVSCASAGSCAAGGFYRSRHGQQGFVAVERHGRWGKAIEVPGLGALNKGQGAEIFSVSCPSAGNCAAGGYYTPFTGTQGFMAVERDGRWGTAIKVPGLAALNTGGDAQVNSLSCATAGNCAAGGFYRNRHGQPGFVAVERHGRWGTAIEVPGLAALSKGDATVVSVSCASAGNCVAGGQLRDRRGHFQGFVVSQTG